MSTRVSTILLVGVFSLFSVPVVAETAAQKDIVKEKEEEVLHWRLMSGVHYSEGDFGIPDRNTQTWVAYVKPQYVAERWDLSLTIPYLINEGLRTPGEEANVGEREELTKRGIGDLVMKGTFYIHTEKRGEFLPGFNMTAKVKFPTAEEADNLGTGEFDYGPGIELYKHLGKLIVMADADYQFRGDPEGIDLYNRLNYSGGIGFPLFSPKVNLYAFYDGATKSVPGAERPEAVFLMMSWRMSERWSMAPYGGVGLSDASPDKYGGLTLTLRF